MIKLNILLSM